MTRKSKEADERAKAARALELDIAKRNLAAQFALRDEEKAKRAAELVLANLELDYQNEEKGKRAVELTAANEALVIQGEERDKLTAELHGLAFYDPLTGVANRRMLLERLGHDLAIAARSKTEGAVLYVNLDNFQDLNDTLGYAHGDLLLQQAARRLRSCLRKGDTVARDGGDEFEVVLVGLDRNRLYAARRAQAVGDKIQSVLRAPYDLDGSAHECTGSIGAVLFSDATSAEELLKRAHIALDQAKATGGRGNFKFFDQQMQDTVNARVALEGELADALERGEFRLHYQVIVNRRREQIGAEALIRWQHPERGMIASGEFITVAEDSGLIVPIGNWVLDAACQQLRTWQSEPTTRALNLSVNISAKQFGMDTFATDMRARMDIYGIDPRRLKLEVTENMLLEDFEMAIAQMTALKEIGFMISLDDFGTGYSSLQYMKRLPLNELKIDLVFVRGIVEDTQDRAIVQAIITLASSLGLGIVAEGVETEAQRSILMQMGCESFQGYLFGKPEASS